MRKGVVGSLLIVACLVVVPGCKDGPSHRDGRQDQSSGAGAPERAGHEGSLGELWEDEAPEVPVVNEVAARVSGSAPTEDETVRVRELVGLLKQRRALQALTPETLSASRLAGLVPLLRETARAETTLTFEAKREDGFVRIVTAMFSRRSSGRWMLCSVSIGIHPADPTRTFGEIRRTANSALTRPKWMDLSVRGTTAWNLGDRWELRATVLEDDDIALRAWRSP